MFACVISSMSASDPQVDEVRSLLTDLINSVLGNVANSDPSLPETPSLTEEQQQQLGLLASLFQNLFNGSGSAEGRGILSDLVGGILGGSNDDLANSLASSTDALTDEQKQGLLSQLLSFFLNQQEAEGRK